MTPDEKKAIVTLAEGKSDGKISAAETESLGLKIWRDADMDGDVRSLLRQLES